MSSPFPSPTLTLAFLAAAVVLVAVPGPNMVYIVTRSMAQGRAAGLVSAAGVESAMLVHVGLAAFGLSTLLTSAPLAFHAVRYAGAAYLCFLAVRAFRDRSGPDGQGTGGPPRRLGRVYRDGVVVNLLNPKVALFVLAFLPQFVTPGASVAETRVELLALGLLLLSIGLTFDIAYALGGAALARRLGGGDRFTHARRYAVSGLYLALATYAAFAP